MRNLGLKFRMAIAGTILFMFYSAIAAVLWFTFNSIVLVAILTVGFIGFQYILGKKLALWSVGAEDMPEQGEYNQIHSSVENLSRDMGIKKPRLMVAEMGVPNAFAVGRKGAGIVVVSKELIQLLNFDELEGVLAHELSHINNRDVVIMVIGQSIATMIGIAVQWGVMLSEDSIASIFMGWIAGTIAQAITMIFVLAISRYREYIADRDAATYIGSGEPLARALEKISGANKTTNKNATKNAIGRRSRRHRGNRRNRQNKLDSSISALCIFGGSSSIARLFSSHPPTEKRIQRLRSL